MAALVLVMIGYFVSAQQPVINLYVGKAPGSEQWNWTEKETVINPGNSKIIYNVSAPTLTVFLPDPAIANGTAAVICPGGAFQILSIESEGYEVARWLNKKGIAAFVLKYRLMHTLSDDPFKELMAKQPNTDKFNEDIRPIVAMGIADCQAAVAYVRNHAAEWKIRPDKIGVIGFSAGGTIATAIAYNHEAGNRPNFAAPIYPYVGSFNKPAVPADAPPMFIAAATDDFFGFQKHCINLYSEYSNSGHSVELHIYAKGGHGFGMNIQHIPTDTWIDRFGDWLQLQGFMGTNRK